MADDAITDEMIREKICQMFLESTKRPKKEYIGIEIEVPIINLNKEAVDFDIVHSVTESFKNHFNSFEVEGIDYDGKPLRKQPNRLRLRSLQFLSFHIGQFPSCMVLKSV